MECSKVLGNFMRTQHNLPMMLIVMMAMSPVITRDWKVGSIVNSRMMVSSPSPSILSQMMGIEKLEPVALVAKSILHKEPVKSTSALKKMEN